MKIYSTEMAANRVKKQEPDKENNILHKRPPSGGTRRLKHSNSSSLEILEPEDPMKFVPPSDRNYSKESRPSSSGKWNSNVGAVPPRSDSSLTRRTPTPTKQISLQAVKRKEDRDDPIVADIDWKELQSHRRHKGRKEDVLLDQFQVMTVSDRGNHTKSSSIPFSYSSRNHNCSHNHGDTERLEKQGRSTGQSKVSKESKKDPIEKEEMPKESELSEAIGGKEESTSDTDSSEEEEERRAPNELLMEFVTCLMEKDYPNAQKLCKMILLYEPNNPEALKFQPLIEEKIALDNEPEFESDESGEDGAEYEDDEDDDDDSDDDSNDSDSDSSDSDSEDSEDDDDEDKGNNRLDSGIASAACSD